jgi:hypothetical protein
MNDFFPPTLDEQIKELRRELDLRRRVYPSFVARKKLTQERADKQMRSLEAAVETLQRCQGNDA